MPLTPGTTVGPYQVTAKIGQGGMGEVYRARDTRLDRTVAIKVLPEDVASDPDLKQRFEREAKTISSLNHPHICPRSPFQSRNEPEAAARESRLTGDRISGSKQGRARAAVSRRTLTDIIFHGGDEGLWARSISTPATRSSTGSYLWIFDEEEEDGCGRCAKPRCKLLWARCLRPWERVYRACLTARRCKSSAQVWWRQRASEAQGR